MFFTLRKSCAYCFLGVWAEGNLLLYGQECCANRFMVGKYLLKNYKLESVTTQFIVPSVGLWNLSFSYYKTFKLTENIYQR